MQIWCLKHGSHSNHGIIFWNRSVQILHIAEVRTEKITTPLRLRDERSELIKVFMRLKRRIWDILSVPIEIKEGTINHL